GEAPEHAADPEEPGRLLAERPPRAGVVERGAEPADRVGERERLAHPVREGERVARHETEEDDRQHDEHCEERRRSRLPRERAEQRACRADNGGRERDADEQERNTGPWLAARDAAELDD